MTQVIQTSKNQSTVAEFSGMTPQEVSIIQNTVAKGCTSTELAFFLKLAQNYKLDPFKKQIWCYKDHRGNLITFAGRDGFLAIAQRNSDFKCINSCEVRENDNFTMNIPMGVINHTFTGTLKSRGAIIGAYAIVDRHSGGKTIVWAEFETYNSGKFVWKSHPSAMICKVAELNACKKAFGISLQSEYAFEKKGAIVIPVEENKKPVNDRLEVQRKLKQSLSTYTGEDKEDIETMLNEKHKANELTIELMQNILDQITTK